MKEELISFLKLKIVSSMEARTVIIIFIESGVFAAVPTTY